MQEAARLVSQVRHELEDAYSRARNGWHDATADHFGARFHHITLRVLDRYVRSAKRLEEEIENAERVASN